MTTAKKKTLSVFECKRTADLHKPRLVHHAIADEVGHSKTTIFKCLKHAEGNGTQKSKKVKTISPARIWLAVCQGLLLASDRKSRASHGRWQRHRSWLMDLQLGGQDWVCQQDNTWRRLLPMGITSLLDHPVCSPGLNATENLWRWTRREVYKTF